MKWIVAIVAANVAGFMLFDGLRAFIVGDYLRPSSGEYSGQLGPWAGLVSALGIDPLSSLMKGIFVGIGASWLVVIVAFLLERRWAWKAMMGFAVGTLWYLTIGTAWSLFAIALLLLPATRRRYRSTGLEGPAS